MNKRGEWGLNSLPEHTTYDDRKSTTGALQDDRRAPKRAKMEPECRQTEDRQADMSNNTDRNLFQTQFSQRKKQRTDAENDRANLSIRRVAVESQISRIPNELCTPPNFRKFFRGVANGKVMNSLHDDGSACVKIIN